MLFPSLSNLFPVSLWHLVLLLLRMAWLLATGYITFNFRSLKWVVSLFVTCQAANTALHVLSEEEYPLISVICYWPSPIGPVPSPCWFLLPLYTCLSGFWTCEPAPWEPGAPSAIYTSYYFSLAVRKKYIVIQWHLDEMHLMDGQAVRYLKEM